MSEFISSSFEHSDLLVARDLAATEAQRVGKTLIEHFGNTSFRSKNEVASDVVTYWDEWAQEQLITGLSAFDASIGILAEEGVDERQNTYWTIDPIDATSHFIRGNKFCTTMIALVDNGVPVVGAIHDFVRGQTYSAYLGGGAHMGELELAVSQRNLESSHVVIYCDEEHPDEHKIRQKIARAGGSILQFSATGYTMLSIARGTMEGILSVHDSYGTEWDTAPGAIIIHEAGGIVSNLRNPSDPYKLQPTDFCMSNIVAQNELIGTAE